MFYLKTYLSALKFTIKQKSVDKVAKYRESTKVYLKKSKSNTCS